MIHEDPLILVCLMLTPQFSKLTLKHGQAAHESTRRFPSSQYKAVYAQAQPSVSLPPAALLEILELLITNVIRHLEAQAHDSAFEDPSERTS
jgi:hypothetical protein